MKKFLLLILVSLFCYQNTIYSQAIGEWTIHMAYHNATKTAPAGNIIYVLSEGSLYSYNTDDSSIQTYDKTNYLNDVTIVDIEYIKAYKTLLIVYDNSNIDLLINNEETFNVSDFMNKSMTEDKTLNNIYINNEYAYLSTNFGIVVLNLKKREITNSYNLGKKVYNTVQVDNTIYAATNEGIYTGKVTDNLLDKSNWKLINTKLLNNIIYYDKNILGITSDGIYIYDVIKNSFNPSWGGNYKYANIYDGQLIVGSTNNIVVFNNIGQKKIINTEYTNHISYENNIYWGSNGENGLNGYKLNTDNNQLEKIIESVIPNSPKRNLFHYMSFAENKLLVAGGSLNYNGIINQGTAIIYENKEWKYLQETGITEQTGLEYVNTTSIVQDPTDKDHYFVGTARKGLYEFRKDKFIKLYSIDNSELQSILPNEPSKYNYVSVNGLIYDDDNNLWMVNNQVSNILKVLKRDGTWLSFNHPEIADAPTFERILIDKRGWIWATSLRLKQGIFCLNTNNTLENTNDDQTIFYSSFINQNNETITPMYFYCITEDLDGTIWIGTNEGPIIINNPSKIFESNSCTQIIVPRNDGTNLGDYLLEHESIKTICVDGNNCKWIGTINSGVYLLSADGLETLHHFTIENSPLISNEIESIAVNHHNGEVFIGTNKGLTTYKSDATLGVNNFDNSLVHAYPNPVPSYHDGLIAITGLMRDSNVKIVDISGKLIYAGTSKGGQFTWNGKNKNGIRVSSGIYMVLATNKEGKEGVVTKIVMIQ